MQDKAILAVLFITPKLHHATDASNIKITSMAEILQPIAWET
ncbi:MAG: hypothetical protein Q6351_000955 [Candidatus Njordarchaeum guaymaensis]